MCECEKSLEVRVDEKEVLGWIEKFGRESSACVPLLQEIQGRYGYLPRAALDLVTANTTITESQLFGVATFYAQFRLKPVGRHIIRICHGTACHVKGADRLNTSVRHTLGLNEKEDTTRNTGYTMEDVACVGCCSLAPCMVIDGQVHGDLTGAAAQKALRQHAKDCGETLEGGK